MEAPPRPESVNNLEAPPRPDLQQVLERRRLTTDDGRSSDSKFTKRVASRLARGMRTARQNVHDLLDEGSFFEYGRFAVAAQRARRSLEELQRRTPADGLMTGGGSEPSPSPEPEP